MMQFSPRSSLVAAVLAITCCAASWSRAADTDARPNILFIISEDNGPELGCYGDPYAHTPNLDTLASGGIRFDRAYVTQAGCSQSRASFLTGLYPHQNGQIGLATCGYRMYREDTPNVPRSLKAVGYRTGIIGKLHVNPESAFPFDFAEIHNGNFARKNLADYAKFAEAFINASTEPFFLAVNYPDAHDPWLRQVDGMPAEPLDAEDVKGMPYFGIDPPKLRESVANYYNCLDRMDTMVGDLLAGLERSGKAGNTLIVYIGDHGADLLRGKRSSYEGGVRIPLIVRWPGHTRSAQVSTELVSTIDLMPTFLAAAGAPPVKTLPGSSLIPLFGKNRADWREYLYTEYHTHGGADNFYPQRTVRNARFKLIENLLPDEINPGYAYTLDHLDADLAAEIAVAPPLVRQAYARMEKPARWELYDLQVDPYEFTDLSNDAGYAAELAELKTKLTQWREHTRDPLLNTENLQRLKDEVSRTSKQIAREGAWGYPYYFLGETPPTRVATPMSDTPKKKKKKHDED